MDDAVVMAVFGMAVFGMADLRMPVVTSGLMLWFAGGILASDMVRGRPFCVCTDVI